MSLMLQKLIKKKLPKQATQQRFQVRPGKTAALLGPTIVTVIGGHSRKTVAVPGFVIASVVFLGRGENAMFIYCEA